MSLPAAVKTRYESEARAVISYTETTNDINDYLLISPVFRIRIWIRQGSDTFSSEDPDPGYIKAFFSNE